MSKIYRDMTDGELQKAEQNHKEYGGTLGEACEIELEKERRERPVDADVILISKQMNERLLNLKIELCKISFLLKDPPTDVFSDQLEQMVVRIDLFLDKAKAI